MGGLVDAWNFLVEVYNFLKNSGYIICLYACMISIVLAVIGFDTKKYIWLSIIIYGFLLSI
jgi:hypothetical protein